MQIDTRKTSSFARSSCCVSRDGSAFTPVWFSSGERSRARNELAADIIPRIISAARLTRSALRFPVAGHDLVFHDRSRGRSIVRAAMMMVCENGKGAEGNRAVWSKRRAKSRSRRVRIETEKNGDDARQGCTLGSWIERSMNGKWYIYIYLIII